MVDIAVMGYGVVGSGVIEVLTEHKDSIARRAKEEINVKYILDIRDFNDNPFADKFIKDFNIILNDPDIKIVVEVIGGLNPAFDFVKSCLLAGKSVVTSNKELVATKGAQLLKIAQEKNVNFLFEASVGGGIPIIRPISQCLAANDVIEIAGILNGTTNFILTKMIREGISFDEGLKLAQKLGYAERDPSADIEGEDACRKICILASLAFGKHVYPKDVFTRGIKDITLEDVEYASNYNSVIKLIGQVKKLDNDQIQVVVAPMFVSKESQLSTVDDVFNGILVRGDATGDVVFYGKGAGKLPTASAVVADIIDCVKHFKARKYLYWYDSVENYVRPYEESEVSVYIRTTSDNVNQTLDIVKENFGDVKRLSRNSAPYNEFAFVSPQMKILDILNKIEILKKSSIEVLSMIRISDV